MAGKVVSINLRLTPRDRDLIDAAAKARGKTRTAFLLDASQSAAREVIDMFNKCNQPVPNVGCICPPTSEQTCGNPICPRKSFPGITC